MHQFLLIFRPRPSTKVGADQTSLTQLNGRCCSSRITATGVLGRGYNLFINDALVHVPDRSVAEKLQQSHLRSHLSKTLLRFTELILTRLSKFRMVSINVSVCLFKIGIIFQRLGSAIHWRERNTAACNNSILLTIARSMQRLRHLESDSPGVAINAAHSPWKALGGNWFADQVTAVPSSNCLLWSFSTLPI